jgi:putative flippase GtrA
MIQLIRRTSRYAQVGLLCALLNNAIVIAMDRAGYHYTLGVIVGFLVVMIVGYVLHASYTFGVRASSAGWLRFIGANLSGFPLSIGAMYVLCDGIGFRASVAMPVATVLLLFWNYLLAYLIIGRPMGTAP